MAIFASFTFLSARILQTPSPLTLLYAGLSSPLKVILNVK